MTLQASVASIPGWLDNDDLELMSFILTRQAESETPGDLAELGVYLGKSAVLIGGHARPSETVTVVDLFDSLAVDEANATENRREYSDLNRKAFEANYQRALGKLPTIIQGPSNLIVESASHRTHRFVHIDASHLYQHVVEDIRSAKTLLRESGVVVFDDIRSQHTPGVAAAAWAEVAQGLRPFAITSQKLYATWGPSESWAETVASWASTRPHEQQNIAGNQVVRIYSESGTAQRWVPPALMPLARRFARVTLPRRR